MLMHCSTRKMQYSRPTVVQVHSKRTSFFFTVIQPNFNDLKQKRCQNNPKIRPNSPLLKTTAVKSIVNLSGRRGMPMRFLSLKCTGCEQSLIRLGAGVIEMFSLSDDIDEMGVIDIGDRCSILITKPLIRNNH